MVNDLVSIVVPTYNRFEKLERAVVSAINQTYENVEIIITSDNDDETNKKLKEKYESLDSKIKFFANTGKKCIGNWNNGIDNAKGKYIKILYDDDWLNYDCIETCVRNIGDHNGVTFKCNNYLSNGEITCGELPCYGSQNREWVYNYLTKINRKGLFEACISPCAYFFRNRKIKFINNFANNPNIDNWGSGSDIIYIMDNLLSNNNNKSLVLIEKVLVNFESHQDSITVKNNTNVIKLTKKGMLYGKEKHNKMSEIRMM